MPDRTKLPPAISDPALPAGGGIRLGTFVTTRWLSIIGQLLCLVIVEYGIGYHFDFWMTLGLLALAPIYNIWLHLRRSMSAQLDDFEAGLQLAFDLTHLSGLLMLTGGLANPFSALLLAPTTVSASLLSRKITERLVIFSGVLLTVLAFSPFPLPAPSPSQFVALSPYSLVAAWVALILTMVFVTTYVSRLAREGQRRAKALVASQFALEREQQLAAIGAVAAAAAHELSTPLGTILLIARERLQELPRDNLAHDDLSDIIEQVNRCREILAEIRTYRQPQGRGFVMEMPLRDVVEEAAAPYATEGISMQYRTSGETPPLVKRSPGLLHALRNLIENAVSYAKTEVIVLLDWDEEYFRVKITDDGPGFDPAVARRLGEPYVTTRDLKAGQAGGMGLGLFIANTLVEREGGNLKIGKAPNAGAWVAIELPL